MDIIVVWNRSLRQIWKKVMLRLYLVKEMRQAGLEDVIVESWQMTRSVDACRQRKEGGCSV